MEKQILEKSSFEVIMMTGYGVDGKKLESLLPELDALRISFKNFTKFVNQQYINGTLEGWEYIDLEHALNNFIIAKVQHIVTKKVSFFEINPLHLKYNKRNRKTEFCGVKETIKFFEKHDCFKNKFIRRLKGWLLK